MSFQEFDFNPKIANGIKAMGFTEPTPIQEEAMPSVLEGRDVLGLAQTGTGKTAAFALPILQRLLKGQRGRVRALVVAPTRELAQQIHDDFCDLGRYTGLRAAVVYGGVGFTPQRKRLQGKSEIVVACPGRLLDHLRQRTVDLSSLDVLVIDEADQLFDMGFLPDIRRIMKHVPRKRQTLFFSATMPRDVEKLASDVLGNPVRVQIGFCKPADTVSHALYPVSQQRKTALLTELLTRMDADSVLVFTRTKHRARKVARQLDETGLGAADLQGNLSQSKRQAALDRFRRGDVRVLVATDIAARGLDVPGISHVINYDIPDTADAYTHRIGRTGRASKSGEAFTFVAPNDQTQLRQIERTLGGKIKQKTLKGFDYGAADDGEGRGRRPARGPRRPGQRSDRAARAGGGSRRAWQPRKSRRRAASPRQKQAQAV